MRCARRKGLIQLGYGNYTGTSTLYGFLFVIGYIISLGHFGHLVGVSRFFSKEINPFRDGQTNELTDAQTIYAVTPLRELVVGCRTQNDSNILHCEEPSRRS